MNHQGTRTIETERLLLRRFTVDDAQEFFQNVTSDLEVNRFLTWPLHETVEDTKTLLSEWTKRYESPERYCWAIVLKETGQIVGTIAAPTVKNRIETVEVTYCIGSKWWGQGIVPEALKNVMKYFFEEIQANRIEAGFDANNPKSGRVMEKVGMKKEGFMRQAGRNNQGLFDLIMYAILKEDWK